MVIFPAIDIRGGKCVRLFKGDFAQETVFSDKPEDMAVKWQQQGGKQECCLHSYYSDTVFFTLKKYFLQFSFLP